MFSQFMKMNTASTSGTLPSNTIPNPKGEMKAITTRSGVAYEGPSIPTNPSPKKVVERETEETTDKEQPIPTHIQPPVIPISIPEPNVPRTLPKLFPILYESNGEVLKIFQDLHFDISFADALLLMPKFASMIKSLLMNKDKLFELSKGMDVCYALADLGASINLMPLSIWKKLSLPELTPTRMTLELADQSITRPKGVAEDVNDEAVTFNLNQTMRYSSTYDVSVNRIDVIDATSEEYAQEVLGFSDHSKSGNPTSSLDPILSSTTPSFTPFEGGDFNLEEIETFLQTPDEFTNVEDDYYNPKVDILYLEQLLNEDPFQLPPMDLKQIDETKAKSSIEEHPKLELKDLPSHLEYIFLEGNDKLPVIIAKGLKVYKKEALLKVRKSHKRAIAWKITDIKGIDP
ncbi:reverse transcriptase domain-containing protein [Tanacetum coccineum]